MRSNLIGLTLTVTAVCANAADFQPIALTSDSYNYDLVVEKTAPPPALMVTTASMEQGTANQGYTWFERGYLPDWPSTGLPKAGSLLTSDQSPDYQYQLPTSYETNNAVLIDSVRTNVVITLAHPTNCAILSFLTSSGVSRNTIRFAVRYQDGSADTGTFVSPNWYNEPNPAWAASGKIDVTTFSHADLTAYNPRLYAVNVGVSNNAALVKSIELSLQSGSGHTAIFGISAAALPGSAFVPVEITGFNEDVVVEASAAKTGFLTLNTTGTIENGTNNSGFTVYERGYNPAAPATGLPAAGSTVTNENDPTHRFALAPDYTDADVILIDSPKTNPVVTFATPAKYANLSLLTASSGGSQTNVCVIRHADGNSETNVIVSPDWLGASAAALTVGGRVSVSTRLINAQPPTVPRFYAVDVPIIDQHSPVTQVTVSLAGSNATGHTVILGMAGVLASTATPAKPALAIRLEANGKLTFSSSQPGRLESCPIVGTASPLYWRDEGPILQSLTINRTQTESARFYRVVVE